MIIDLLRNKQYQSYVESTNQAKIVFEENKSKYVAINKNRKYVYKLKIDKGMINDNKIIKCDYGLYIDNEHILILIELKGEDINHAFKQVLKTYEWLYNKAKDKNVIMKVRVIVTSVDRNFDVDFERKKLLKLAKWKINKNDIIVKERFEDKI